MEIRQRRQSKILIRGDSLPVRRCYKNRGFEGNYPRFWMSGSRNDHVQVKAEYSLALRHLALE